MTNGITHSIRVGSQGNTSLISYDETTLWVTREDQKHIVLEVPLRQVLWTECTNNQLELQVLSRRNKKFSLHLTNINGKVTAEDAPQVLEWTENLLSAAYAGVKRKRKLRVLINPAGGPGKARPLFIKKVEPILRAARCQLDITYTERRNHAQDICKELPLDFDAVMCLSGDGTLHEAFNGFAQHKFPMRALRIPVVPVPTGSGNAMSLNLLGLKEGFDVSTAALNAIKGTPMEIDLFSMTMGEKRIITFMTQCVGLTADLDLGTEHLRWMGDTRFLYGFIAGALKFNECPVKLSIKVAEQDKDVMVDKYQSIRTSPTTPKAGPSSSDNSNDDNLSDEDAAKLPPLQCDRHSKEGWIEFDKSIIYVYAGQGPYVSRDLMQFPVSLPNDGLIDVVVQERTSRASLLKGMNGGEHGLAYWLPMQHYYKAIAYRISRATPYAKVRLSVDGEGFDFEDFQVEVHQGLGRVLSMSQGYAPQFEHSRPETKQGTARRRATL